MKKFILLISISAGLLFANDLMAESFWEATNGPYGLFSPIFALDSGGGVIASTMGLGIYRSTNDGASWNLQSNDFIGFEIWGSSMAVSKKGDLYLSINLDTINPLFKSTNFGKTWTKVYYSKNPINSYSLAIAKNGNIIVSTYDEGMYISSDNGEKWKQVGQITDSTFLNGISSFGINKNGDIYAAAPYNNNIFKSTNNGNSWQSIYLDLFFPMYDTEIKLNSKGDIFLLATLCCHGYLCFSDNNGLSWKLIDFGDIYDYKPYSLVIDKNDEMYLSTSKGILKSTDNGDKWELIYDKIEYYYLDNLIITPESTFLGSSYMDGIYRSITKCKSWANNNSGIAKLNVKMIETCKNGKIYTSSTIEPDKIKANKSIKEKDDVPLYYNTFNATNYSIDNGISWKFYAWDFDKVIQLTSSVDNSTYWLGRKDNSIKRNILYRDYSSEINNYNEKYEILCIATDKLGNIYAASSKGDVHYSMNKGRNWQKISKNLDSLAIYSLTINNDEDIIAATDSGIFLFRFNAQKWELVNNSFRDFKFIKIKDEVFFAGTKEMNGLFKSIDSGKTWISLNKNIDNCMIDNIYPITINNLISVSKAGNLYQSVNGGMSWFPIKNELEGIGINCVTLGNDDTLYIGTDRGVYKSKKKFQRNPILKLSIESNNKKVLDWQDTIEYTINVRDSKSNNIRDAYIFIRVVYYDNLDQECVLMTDSIGILHYKTTIPRLTKGTGEISFLAVKASYEDSGYLTDEININHIDTLILKCTNTSRDTLNLDWEKSVNFTLYIYDSWNRSVYPCDVKIEDSLQLNSTILHRDDRQKIIYTDTVPQNTPNGIYPIIFTAIKDGYNNSLKLIKYIKVNHIYDFIENNSQKSDLITISPNPVNSSLKIKFMTDIFSKFELVLFDIYGNSMLKKEFDAESGINELDLNIENYPAGVYLLKINSSRTTFFKKIIKN